MRKTLTILLVVLLAGSLPAQNSKGDFYVGTGVKVFGDGHYINYIGKTGISFTRFVYEAYNGGPDKVKVSDNTFSYSLAPRVGYFIGNRFAAGVDLQYWHIKYHYFNNNAWEKTRVCTGGIFIKYFFNENKLSPTVEIGSGMGASKETDPEVSPGGAHYQRIDCKDLIYINAAAGVSYSLTPKIKAAFLLKYQITTEKHSDRSNFSTSRGSYSSHELGPVITFSYKFN